MSGRTSGWQGRVSSGGFVARTFVSVSQILFARLDVILLAALTDTRHAAIYTAATRFVVVAH